MINLADYTDFYIFLGGLILVGGVLYVFLGRRLEKIFIAEQEVERLISEEEISRLQVPNQRLTNQILFPRTVKNICSQIIAKKLSVILLIIIVAGFLFNQFLMWKMGSSGILNKLFSISINITRK